VIEPTQPTGVMIIKVWFEPSGPRARLTATFDVEHDEPAVVNVASSAAAIQAVVAEWLARCATYQGPS
jgi:hypothetical protein